MWSYYGAKTNIVKAYPKPKYDAIREPFAGTARYSLQYFEHDITLVDKYEVIVKIWKWLQLCSPGDILKLPRPKSGDNINHFNYDCEEARLLMGFVSVNGSISPTHHATVRPRHRSNEIGPKLKRISENLFKIKHWKIIHGSYEDIPNEPATWFIDPPYQFGGHYYIHSSKKIDFNNLAKWCKDREGQVIVCEGGKADWLPFKPFTHQNVLSGKNNECIWTNYPTQFDNEQMKLTY